ncbi:hypothetical protein KIH74_22860 [Kineosporia sp. J2-2]|uniref:Uncharacterized protein n=1 Tax=Kineosporia corallincola TaxID=2835133 RepID=A0ABS5TL16_9ACTN|nr:hypothetical protein [Kineosporia corallincola]MBT0771800.1 hypothetical protein [Kineosporia corallincola]
MLPALSRGQADKRYALAGEVDARMFGVVANGGTTSAALTANTVAMQSFVDYLTSNRRSGVLPPGDIRINGKINFRRRPEWGLRGLGRGVTRMAQLADNMPIFDLGTDQSSSMHSWHLRDMSFAYWNPQPATNTDAICVLCSDCPYNGEFRNLRFENGYYGFKTIPGQVAPWGCVWDGLDFGAGLTGGAINWYGTQNAVPNNTFGRLQAACDNMTSTVFAVRGYNFRIDSIEFLHNTNHQILMDFNSGSVVSIGSIKLEQGKFLNNNPLLRFSTNAKAEIDNLWIGGGDVFDRDIAGGGVAYLVTAQGSDGGWDSHLDIRHLIVSAFVNKGAGAVAAVNIGGGAAVRIGRYIDIGETGDIPLTNSASSDSSERLTVTDQIMPRLSRDLGDADYAPTWRGPNILTYQTVFTAPRALNLPSDPNNLFNGQYFEVLSDGAVNGTNTLTIKCGTTNLRIITTDKVKLRYQWRRPTSGPTANGWILTQYETLP